MTTIESQAGEHHAATLELAGLTLSWDVLPDAPGVRALIGDRADVSETRLVMEVEDRTMSVYVEVVGAAQHITRISVGGGAKAPITATPCGDEVLHIEAPGVLRATLVCTPGRGGGQVRPVYARTPLLASLGFPGGSYDRPVVAWPRAANR